MDTLSNAVVLAYHGCRKAVAESVLSGGEGLKESNKPYDWLGSGIYFWEADPLRGFEWAQQKYGDDAAVIGAALHLGRCLNLMPRQSASLLRGAYESLSEFYGALGQAMPVNQNGNNALDCMVINALHGYRDKLYLKDKEHNRPFDTVRGLYLEGSGIFPGSMLQDKTHIQICVRNTRVIKGYFRVPEEHLESL